MQLRIEPSTLVRVLDRIERDGWIVRRPSPQHHRKNIIHDEKVTQWAIIVECGEHMERRATTGLSETQLAALKETLAAIRENLKIES